MNNIDPKLYPQYNFKFDGVKDTYDKYYLAKDTNGELAAVEKSTNTVIKDSLIIDRVKFAIAWAKSTQTAHPRTTPNSEFNEKDYEYAFNEGARLTYASMMTCINNQLLTTGNIDPIEVLSYVENTNYKYSVEYVKNIFSKKIYVEALDKWARHAIPNALEPTQELMTLDELNKVENNSIHKM